MSPGLAFALLLVLIGAQVTRVVRPHRARFPLLVLLAALGLFAGELVAIAVHAGGPTLGVLHPLADAIGIGVCEGLGTSFAPQRRRIP